jgi:hypothetical protein
MSTYARRQRRRLITPQGQHFIGIWNVVAGDTGKGNRMMITSAVGDIYELKYLFREDGKDPQWKLLQELEYMPDTNTLENRVGDDGRPLPGEPERCITFWNRISRNRRDKCAIFAMRKGQNPGNISQLPFFEQWEEGGSWGAEEEAPP